MSRTKKNYNFTVDPNKVRKSVRDENIKNMISTPGGVTRVFKDKKKSQKADKAGRNRKHKSTDAE